MEHKRISPRSPRAALEPEHVPVPTRRSKRVRHPLVIAGNAFITFLVLLAIAVGAALVIGKQRFEAPGPLPTEKIVNIPHGGLREVAGVLRQEGVIDQPLLFMAGVFVHRARGGVKAGEYQFSKHASLSQVVDTLIEGRVVQHAITIPEGLTSEQIVARLLDNDVLSGNVNEIPHEGTLLPDTYQFPRSFPRERVIKLMELAQQRVVKEIWAHRSANLPLKSPEELVILASLVEKETGKPEERSRVASVFVNRLKRKMRLQSDPTIIYGLVGGKGSLGRPIKRSEIEQPTPYNTYVIDGLPPAPIANPGRASLEAAANPARTKDLYFVADGKGSHLFSETYAEHQKNVAQLRALEQQEKKATATDVVQDGVPTPKKPPANGTPSH
jgi:peptidoglycan lytic transglycosylase G